MVSTAKTKEGVSLDWDLFCDCAKDTSKIADNDVIEQKQPITVKFSKVCSEGFHRDTDRRCCGLIYTKSKVDSAFYPPWDCKVNINQTAVMLCGCGVKAGMV